MRRLCEPGDHSLVYERPMQENFCHEPQLQVEPTDSRTWIGNGDRDGSGGRSGWPERIIFQIFGRATRVVRRFLCRSARFSVFSKRETLGWSQLSLSFSLSLYSRSFRTSHILLVALRREQRWTRRTRLRCELSSFFEYFNRLFFPVLRFSAKESSVRRTL